MLDQVRHALRTRHYSPRTEDTHVGWAKRFILFHNKRHREELGERDISASLTALGCRESCLSFYPESSAGIHSVSVQGRS